MKINIKNLLFQPLALHLATDGHGLHLSSRECKEILTEHISQEIQLAAARGIVSFIGKASEGADDALNTGTSEDVAENSAQTDESQVRQKKGRAR